MLILFFEDRNTFSINFREIGLPKSHLQFLIHLGQEFSNCFWFILNFYFTYIATKIFNSVIYLVFFHILIQMAKLKHNKKIINFCHSIFHNIAF